MKLTKSFKGVYASEDILSNLIQELGGLKYHQKGALVLVDSLQFDPIWCQNIWHKGEVVEIKSINDACGKLKERDRLWIHNPIDCFRRGELILKGLSHFKPKLYPPFTEIPDSKISTFGLLSENEMVVLTKSKSSLPNGEINFIEDKENPPSRAYLKLWEVFTRLRLKPKKGDVCLDIGASPGGWSWVLSQLGAKVIAYDRSPLTIRDANISFIKGDGFNVLPETSEKINWLVSDIIAFPIKQYEYILKWIESEKAENIVATFKFKGHEKLDSSSLKVISELKKIPNSILIHLTANKNELTFVYSTEVESFIW